MIRFELGNQICVCLSENDISLEINNTLHHAIPVSSNEYAILSTIATYGSLNAPISQRVIERKITQHYKMALPENGFKKRGGSIEKEVSQAHGRSRFSHEKHHRKHSQDGIFHPFYHATYSPKRHLSTKENQPTHEKQRQKSPSYLLAE